MLLPLALNPVQYLKDTNSEFALQDGQRLSLSRRLAFMLPFEMMGRLLSVCKAQLRITYALMPILVINLTLYT